MITYNAVSILCSVKYPELHVRGKLKQCLTEWCADDVKKAFDKDEEVHLNLQIFALKDLHANWMIKICSEMDKKKDKVGILEYIS